LVASVGINDWQCTKGASINGPYQVCSVNTS
jgi:hypothetical protein